MIVTKQKDCSEILKFLEGKARIFIVGCGDCAATCKTGGEKETFAMLEFLKAKGKDITGTEVLETACVSAQAKSAFARRRQELQNTDAILVLACGSGVQCVKSSLRLDIDVFPGCDSLFAALIQPDGTLSEVCSSCGECMLDMTEGICPVTRCAKSLKNGPCGGQAKGKCEVDRHRDCAWVLIYKELKVKGRLEVMKKCLPPRDHSRSAKPGADVRP